MFDCPLLHKLSVESSVDLLEGGIALDDGVYKVSDSKYFLVDSSFEGDKEKVTLVSIFWACSESAFRRVYFKYVENDDLAKSPPPAEFLPFGTEMNYGSIRSALKSLDPDHFLECASYRVMSDGAFIHKSLESLRVIYYFRSPEVIEGEFPCAIMFR